MACPICGRHLCDHTAEERGQTNEQLEAEALGISVGELRRAREGQKKGN